MIKNIIVLTIVLLSFFSSSFVFGKNDALKVSILTVSKGVDVHSLFGHTAIRVRNLDKHTDHVYNFGLFDFNTPFFFYKFLSGKLPYKLGRHKYFDFLKLYATKNRSIDEQFLALNNSVKTEIADTLQYLLQPENSYYNYEFFEKNCTSQIRDILFECSSLADSLTKNVDIISYRDMLNVYLDNRQWYKLGINLIVGTYVDKKLNKAEAMALPEMFMDGLNEVKINNAPLVYKHNTIVKNSAPKFIVSKLLSPFIIFSLLLLLFLFFKFPWIKLTHIVFSSATGLFLIVLWAITDHVDLQNNWDVLFANPFYLILVLKDKKYKRVVNYIALILLALVMVRIMIALMEIQIIANSFIPIILLNVAILIQVIFEKRKIKNTSSSKSQ